MSGVHRVHELLVLIRRSTWTPEEQRILKSVKLHDENFKPINSNQELLRRAEKTDNSSIVHLGADDKLIFTKDIAQPIPNVPAGPSSAAAPLVSSLPVPYSAEAVREIIQGKSLEMDLDKIRKVLYDHMASLPKTEETYSAGQIKIFFFKDVDMNVTTMIAAGTKSLDAVLFHAYSKDEDKQFIFELKEMSIDLDRQLLTNNITMGNLALKAAVCMVFCQGCLPSITSDPRNLIAFVKNNLFRGKDMDHNTLCRLLSCSDPALFPGVLFLDMPLDILPTDVASRCKVSVAGNKALRYAVAASRYEKNTIVPPTMTDFAEVARYTVEVAKLEKAQKIVDQLCSFSTDFDAQKAMHPLNPNRATKKDFTLQLTGAIMFSRSYAGRLALRKWIDDENISAYKKDINIYGTLNQAQTICFPVLENSRADFSDLTVEAIRLAYKKA